MEKIILKYAKTKEELLNAPANAQTAMIAYAEYRECYNELRTDMIDRFPSPTLWAAIDRLIYFKGLETENYNELKAAGYTIDDAFALQSYDKQGVLS